MLARNKCRAVGFTLVELLITLAVIGLVMTLSISGYQTWLANQKIRAYAESIRNALQYAKNEAIKQNAIVEFSLNADSSWQVRLNGTNNDLQSRPAGEAKNLSVTTNGGAVSVAFNSVGRVWQGGNAAVLTQVDVDVPTSVLPASESKELRVQVSNPGGAIRLCDPSVTDAKDPRSC